MLSQGKYNTKFGRKRDSAHVQPTYTNIRAPHSNSIPTPQISALFFICRMIR